MKNTTKVRCKLVGLVALLVIPNVVFAKPSEDDVSVPTEWVVTVSENDVERTMRAVDPQDLRFSFPVDQSLAPGWACEVLPEIWHGTSRWRWLTCQFHDGRAKVSVRTTCRSDRSSNHRQEMWIGEKLSVSLACRSGISP